MEHEKITEKGSKSPILLAKLSDLETAKKTLHYFAPMGEKDEFVEKAVKNISPYLSH